MASENTPGGRPSNEEIEARRGKVKEMLLQGATYREMEQALGVSSATIYADVSYWQEYFKKLAQDNPEIAKMTFSKVQQTLGEIDIVKRQYWARYQKLLKAEEEQEQAIQAWKVELQAMKVEYQQALDSKDRAEIRRLEKKLKENGKAPRFYSYHKNLLETLKLIMDRIDKEAKLLNLFNPEIGQSSGKNAITWENFKAVMLIVKQLILDLVPEDQRTYAFQRLRRVKIDEVKPEDIMDAQIVEQAPKVGLTRIQAPEVAPEPQQEAPVEAPVKPVEPKKPELDNQGLEDLDI